MQIKFPPLINVNATYQGIKAFGEQTVVMELAVNSKIATITMNKDEANALVEGFKKIGINGSTAAAMESLRLGGIKLPKL